MDKRTAKLLKDLREILTTCQREIAKSPTESDRVTTALFNTIRSKEMLHKANPEKAAELQAKIEADQTPAKRVKKAFKRSRNCSFD